MVKINVTLKQKEIKMFRLLRMSSFELGGSIELSKSGDNVKEVKVINGTRTYVTVDSMPISRVNFHSHPSVPNVPNGKDILDYTLEYYYKNKKKDFPVNIFCMPVSNDDLTAMTTSLVENRNCVMMIFCPEGIYTLFRTKKNGSFEEFKKEYIKEKKWIKAADNYLVDRDYSILKEFDNNYFPKLKNSKTSHSIKRKYLSEFQKKTGKMILVLVKKHFPIISVKFYSWNTPEINLTGLQCEVCPRLNGKKIC